LGAGAAMQPFAEMRSLSIVCFARTLGTAAPGHNRSLAGGVQIPRAGVACLDLYSSTKGIGDGPADVHW
jgi:hypothetical protein